MRTIAHDLNGPLTGINLTLQALRRLSCSRAVEKLVQNIDHDLVQATSLLEELKTLNKRETYRLKRLDIGEELTVALEKHILLEKNRLEVKYIKPSQPLFVLGDSSRLWRVWQNILCNTMDALGAKPTADKVQLSVGIKKMQKLVRIQFTDDAGGIPKKSLSRLFEPFYTTKGKKNRGLGLFIAHKIIDEHRGSISVASRPPFTRVTLKLPLAP
ncbi:MAG: Sporulation kinase A [Turneriella sp.]|nr:Sporulation kinase A [Turneriella sp.]